MQYSSGSWVDVLELLRGISNIVVCYCCVQTYVDGVNYKILCFLFGFVWTRCVFSISAILRNLF